MVCPAYVRKVAESRGGGRRAEAEGGTGPAGKGLGAVIGARAHGTRAETVHVRPLGHDLRVQRVRDCERPSTDALSKTISSTACTSHSTVVVHAARMAKARSR